MTAIFIVDTLELSKKLIKTGLKQKTAEVLAEEFKKIGEQSTHNLATEQSVKDVKKDIKILERDIKRDIKILENKLRGEIKTAMLTTIISLGAIIALTEKLIN